MTDAADPLELLASHAHDARVVVIGGGIGGLVAALECAKVGIPVTVLEAGDRLGGTIATIDVDGLPVDVGTTCWSTKGGAVRSLVDDLGLGDRVVTSRTDRTWIAGLPKAVAAPLPDQSVLGIPANPWDESVRRIIGWKGAWRAYLDRLRPPLTIGKEHNLGKLVRSRMGAAVHDRLVAPLTAGGFGVTPDEVDVVVAAPGLTSALTRTGSLGGAVADLLVDRETRRTDAPVESLDGGMGLLVSALEDRLRLLGADIVLGARVARLASTGRRWRVDVDSVERADEGGVQVPDADVVVLATGRAEALRLLGEDAPLLPGSPAGEGVVRETVTLVVDEPALDRAPRGAQVYPVPGAHGPSGLVHQTARWEWLARTAGPGRHVVTVAFDLGEGPASARPHVGRAEAEPVRRARDAASALLGVPLPERAVRAALVGRFELAPPASLLGRESAAADMRSRLRARPGLAAVGGWLAGSGLARIVIDAQAEADRVRRSVLFGGSERA